MYRGNYFSLLIRKRSNEIKSLLNSKNINYEKDAEKVLTSLRKGDNI